MRAIDCQSFAGGLTLGFARNDFDIVRKVEAPGGFGTHVVEHNMAMLGDFEIQVAPPSEWDSDDVDVVFGNPPCSGFSMIAPVRHHGTWEPGPDSPVNECMWDLMRFASRCQPQIIVMESVQFAFKRGRDLMMDLRALVEKRTGKSWSATHVLHNVASCGGYAQRARYFLVLSRVPFGVTPHDGPPQLLGDALRVAADGKDGQWTLDQQNLAVNRISNAVALSRLLGGKWTPGMAADEALDLAIKLELDVSPWFREDGQRLTGYRHDNYRIRRWRTDRLANVVTGFALVEVMHPTEDRFLTMREVGTIQGFPAEWEFDVPGTSPSVRGAWPGKGVAVQVAEWIARNIASALDGSPGSYVGERIGEREYLIDTTHDWKRFYNNQNGNWTDSRNDAQIQAHNDRAQLLLF